MQRQQQSGNHDLLEVAGRHADIRLGNFETMAFRASAMSVLVTEPNSLPSTPAFWEILTS